MTAVVRRLAPDEIDAFRHSEMIPFLDPFAGDPDQVADRDLWADKFEADRAWVVDDDGRLVGNGGVCSLDVTLPAAPGRPCPTLAIAGVTAVGVHPTHRRQGILGRLMRALHDDARSRGEAVAGLEASESSIYGRFGYGLASMLVEYSIDSRAAAFDVGAPAVRLALVDRHEALELLPPLFDLQRRTRAAEVSRSPAYWAEVLSDRPHRREGLSARFHVVGDGGYALYRVAAEGTVFRGDRAAVVVDELRGLTPDVEAALWRFVLDIDLVGEVTVRRAAVDEPIRWRLSDPRRLRTAAVEDRLYVRILDTGAAFASRGYQAEGRLVLEVSPPAAKEGDADPAPGRWVLEAGPDGATCDRARPGSEVDLRLGLPALGSLWMGGFPASVLAAGGRVEEVRPGALAVADALLTTRPSPRSGTGF